MEGQLTVRPSPGAVYDRREMHDFFSQQNNIGRLNDKQLPIRPTGLVAIPGDRKVPLDGISVMILMLNTTYITILTQIPQPFVIPL